MKTWLLMLLGFTAITAIPGGTILILFPDGRPLRAQTDILFFTPFSSFLLPGLILLMFVGGSSLAAFIQLRNNNLFAKRYAFAAGAVLLGWMTGELLLVRTFSWLQPIYFICGVVILILAGRLKRSYESNYLQHQKV